MKEFLEYLLQNIVDHPDEIRIEEDTLGDHSVQYTIFAKQEDIGKIIGREGKIIQAIRNLVKVLAVKENKQVRVEIGETKPVSEDVSNS